MSPADPPHKPRGTGRAFWEDLLRLPLQIVLVGGAVTLVGMLLQHGIGMPSLSALQFDDKTASGLRLVVAVLIFAVGIAAAVFLWWLSSRFFGLIEGKSLDAAGLAAVKDLPLGLPEGTVRAVLALVVAVVGLPLLLFSNVVGMDPAIAGYINGIVTGVFGFYFGTRTTGVPAQAVDKIAEANREAMQQTKAAASAKETASQAQSAAQSARQELGEAQQRADENSGQLDRASKFDTTLSTVKRHLGVAKTVLVTLGPLLPKGLLPDDLDKTIDAADRAVTAVQGVTAATASADQLSALTDAFESLTGSGKSPLGALLGKAAPLLQNVLPAIPGLGAAAGLATLIGLGVKLGSSQFQRWRARVLAAPLAQGLIEFGALSPELVRSALNRSPLLRDKLAEQPPGDVNAALLDAVLRDDGPQRLLAAYGPAGTLAAGLLTEADVDAGLAELRQSLLALYGAGDVQDSTLNQVKAALAGAANPELAATAVQSLTARDANRLIDAASGISAQPGVPWDQAAAFDALVMLTDSARRDNVDLVRALAEVK
ncbi:MULTISPECIES: hypothetical protein [Roseateles]|uniref:Uncharacterized protein n=1 Tax=Pelomonas caseinilytica TaxID=2906763 RepID=A0ABS8XHX7_9BURK|nr:MULTISPECIES: hypothetical protein [unclassified Roseateles]MCE4538638.1 hypothetical protein [Pelomonas sp. P7]HEV6964032.1 hypothetical protein [Roseateles sp.]